MTITTRDRLSIGGGWTPDRTSEVVDPSTE
jgi:hypothetical protein